MTKCKNERLLQKIINFHEESGKKYGSPIVMERHIRYCQKFYTLKKSNSSHSFTLNYNLRMKKNVDQTVRLFQIHLSKNIMAL